jgi:glucosamine--fructose-6-phosphate aminotransferase (isomerizing)
MCGIVAGVSAQNVVPVLVQGLARLEYRGYDSCGIAVFSNKAQLEKLPGLQRARSTSRVSELAEQVFPTQPGLGLEGLLGIAHTRWATHGAPHVDNAHPHFSVNAKLQIGLVHTGIIEN